MDIEHILRTLNRHGVEYLLIGGMNFLIKHNGPTTYDVDFFINDTPANRAQLNHALIELECEWGKGDEDWTSVPANPSWLETQSVFCLTSKHGAVDVFRSVRGLDDGFEACKLRADRRALKDNELYFALSDEDMLQCQEALPENDRKKSRVEVLRKVLGKNS